MSPLTSNRVAVLVNYTCHMWTFPNKLRLPGVCQKHTHAAVCSAKSCLLWRHQLQPSGSTRDICTCPIATGLHDIGHWCQLLKKLLKKAALSQCHLNLMRGFIDC